MTTTTTPISYESCLDFEADPGDAHDVCRHCGWLDDEHWFAPVVHLRPDAELRQAS